MVIRYLSSLAVVIVIVTAWLSTKSFVTLSRVLSGSQADEVFHFEFTINEGSQQAYVISRESEEYLRTHISFPVTGPALVAVKSIYVAGQLVSWNDAKRINISQGVALTAQLRWATPSDSPNGVRSSIALEFPRVPGLENGILSIRSEGGYFQDGKDRYVIREITTYRSTIPLMAARFFAALSIGLPFGIALHAICWALVLKREKRLRLSVLPGQEILGAHTFYPNPIAEWSCWTLALGIGTAMVSVATASEVYNAFMGSLLWWLNYAAVALIVAIAAICAYWTGKNVLTVRVGGNGISYARGRSKLVWSNLEWSEIQRIIEICRTSSYIFKTYWIEVQFYADRDNLEIKQSTQDYSTLRDLLFGRQISNTDVNGGFPCC